MSDLVDRPAVELAAMIRRREVSAVELLEASLSRIDHANPHVNAVVTVVADRALADAADADRLTAAGGPLGVLHGLPVAHKDLEPTAGIRTTFGSPLFADFVPDHDGLVVERMRSAGAVTVGKTNTPEFGAGSQTFNPVFGATRNPFDTTRTCGGSSGGAAVALACGMVPIADGSDMGGSLRNPASFCNVVGLRPSTGRVPSWPNSAPRSPLSTAGVLARSVDDLVLQLQVVAGPDERVPISRPEPGEHFARVVDGPPLDPRRLRVAWTPDLGLPVDADVTAALADVPDRLATLGCDVTETFPDLSDAGEIFSTWRAWHFEVSYGAVFDTAPDAVKDTVRWNIELARSLHLVDLAHAEIGLNRLIERVRLFFERVDVLALPTCQVTPFPVDIDWPRTVGGVEMDTYVDWMRSCSDVSVTGCPAVSMPSGFTAGGLPVGVQFVGRPGGDVDLLRFARLWEAAFPVGRRRATVPGP